MSTQQKWISVKERLPEPNDFVIGYCPDCPVFDVRMVVLRSFNVWFPAKPTHWMPLPEIPKEDDEKRD